MHMYIFSASSHP